MYLRLTDEGERRLDGALRERDRYRRELAGAFGDLIESFRVENRRRR